MSQPSARQEARRLAEELLDDIELSRLPPTDVARKTSRLARLLDDQEAMTWLHHEIAGYTIIEGAFAGDGWNAAVRSNRAFFDADAKGWKAYGTSLGELQANIDASLAQLAAAADAPVSVSSANPNQFVAAPSGNTNERASLRNYIGNQRQQLDKIVGALHQYVAARYQELRFGSAVETAFETVRSAVDGAIGGLIPDGLPKLTTALENAASNDPEQWANAAAGCRRLLKAAADALRPAGPPVDDHLMDEEHYVNRLVAWVVEHVDSQTRSNFIEADLQYLDRRLHAALEAGHKGAHAEVTRVEAAKYVTSTYLVLGDILALRSEQGEGDESVNGGLAAEAAVPERIDPQAGSSAGAET